MLDCASTWDIGVPSQRRALTLAPEASVGLAGPGILREEFFGGLYYNRSIHRQAMVDIAGFEVLRSVVENGSCTTLQLVESLGPRYGEAVVAAAVADLVASAVLAEGAGDQNVRFIPAHDLSKAYLQAPTIVEAELTYGCFRACRHCAYSSSPTARTDDELSADDWATVFGKLADAGVFVIQLTGGDPLFRPDAFDIVEAADRAGLSVYVRSDTLALTDENLDRLQALDNLWHIGTSIDGADEISHDWMRGKGAFDTLVDRMTRLAERGIPVAAGATLHRSNASTVREIGRVAVENGARWFDIGFLSPVGRAAGMASMVLDETEVRTALADYLGGVDEGVYEPSHAHYGRRIGREVPFADIESIIPVLPYVTEWPWSRLRVSPTGSTYTAGKLKGSDFAGGFNLLTSDVVQVWNTSPNLVKLRELGGGRIHSLDFRLLRSDHQFT
jgi:MoaA/NifB/PqqE/SkfB family radical SAM enzyme